MIWWLVVGPDGLLRFQSTRDVEPSAEILARMMLEHGAARDALLRWWGWQVHPTAEQYALLMQVLLNRVPPRGVGILARHGLPFADAPGSDAPEALVVASGPHHNP